MLVATHAELETLVGFGAATISKSELHSTLRNKLCNDTSQCGMIMQPICGCCYIIVTCKEVYNSAVHYTSAEYKALTGESVDVQAQVE